MAMLDGKRILITGAATGIGRATARCCAREGAVIGLGFHSSQEAAQQLADEITEQHQTRVHLLPIDLRDGAAIAGQMACFAEHEGGIDGLVNNAAINLPGLLVSQSDEAITEQVGVNLVGTILCARAVLPAMLEQRSGVIVNLSSLAARRPARGQSVYAATKGALESLTRALAVEYGRKGIRVHAVRPGAIDTSMLAATRSLAGNELRSAVPLRRLGQPQEVAELITFLLSDRAAFITGSVHTIDGGMNAGLVIG